MDKELLIKKASEVFNCKSKFIVIEGTEEHYKFAAGIIALLNFSQKLSGNYLIRVNSIRQAEQLERFDSELSLGNFFRQLIKNRKVNFGTSVFYLDTVDKKSQLKTPVKLNGVIIYMAELFDKNVDQIQDFKYMVKENGKVILSTFTDNIDFNWVEGFNPYHIVFHSENKETHNRMLSVPNHKKESEYFIGLKKETDNKSGTWKEALDNITIQVNVSTGLSHPSDKAFATKVLRNLFSSGEKPSDNDIRIYLIKSGWDDKYAKDVIKIWNSFSKNKKVG